jgi:phage terminase large subunit-like protein
LARARKTLAERIRDCTFEGRREAHRDLLDGPLVEDDQLAELQAEYQETVDEAERKLLALEFEKAIKSGHGRRSRAELDEILAELGPPGSAERIIGMFPRFYRLENGAPWVLDPEMQEFIREAHSRDAEGRRLYKVILYGVPKGGAKTPMATGHGLEALTRNDGVRPLVMQAAGSKKQASLGTQYAEFWVNGTDEQPGELAQWIRTKQGLLKLGRGEYRIESSDGALAQGPKPTVFIIDEWWQYQHLGQREVFAAGEGALHKEPEAYLLAISTETWDPHAQMAEWKDHLLRTAPDVEVRRDGCLTIARDPEAGSLMWWYGAPADFDPDQASDEELLHVIRMCNPGPWVDHREQLRGYKRSADKLDWRRLQLNQRTKTRDAWLPAGTWPGLKDETAEIPEGSTIVVGVDAAYSDDSTAVAWAWHDGERALVRAHAWTVHPDQPGEYVAEGTLDNEALVEPFIHQLAERYKVAAIVFDPRYFLTESKHLEADGFLVVPIYPGSLAMRQAEQEFKKAALAGRISHDGDRTLSSHIESVVWKQTGTGGKIDKLAGHKIDAATAAVMAVWQCLVRGFESNEGWVLKR